MKKFKLIKEYPGSPELWTIAKQCQDDDGSFINNIRIGDDWEPYHISFCSDYPEFWQEIIEKDYEILEFYVFNNSSNKKGFSINKNAEELINKLLKDYKNIEITKVKRLSDWEIFEVGDFVKINNESAIENVFRITNLELFDNEIIVNKTQSNPGVDFMYITKIETIDSRWTDQDMIDFAGSFFNPDWLAISKDILRHKLNNYKNEIHRRNK